jgi:hypothetical protein
VHWDGSFWTAWKWGSTPDLNAIWGSGSKDIWTVGGNGAIYHWDGNWLALVGPTNGNFTAVSGCGPSDVWAMAGSAGAFHWDGKVWSSIPLGTSQTIGGVWCGGPHDVWAVGAGETILHWQH